MLTLLLSAALAAAPAEACPAGKSISPDTHGACCWPGQAFSTARQVCVGIPTCPAGLAARGEDCACAEGMEVSPDTAGHCCWPLQAWSNGRQLCVGAPRCPPNMQTQGETCVAATQSPSGAPPPPPPPPPAAAGDAPRQPPPPPPPAATAAPSAPSGQETEVDGIKVPPGHHVEYKRHVGLLAGGIAVLGAGWLVSILVSLGGGAYAIAFPKNTCWAAASEVGWVPLIGPPVAMLRQADPSLQDEGGHQCQDSPVYPIGFAVAVVDTVAQWAGLAMLIVGIIVRSPVVVADDGTTASSEGHLDWHVTVGAPGSPLGLGVALTW